jgi:ABC-type lipoprotein release transport system permease subunit
LFPKKGSSLNRFTCKTVTFSYYISLTVFLKPIALVSKIILIMVLVGAFATVAILEADGVFAEGMETKFLKINTTMELEKEKTDKACMMIDKFLQDTNNLVEKDKLAQTDADSLLDSGKNVRDTIGCT